MKQSGGKLEPLGDIYEAAPYGYVLPKDETEFADAIVEALKEIEGRRQPTKTALEKWGIEQGAISDFAVNPVRARARARAPTPPRKPVAAAARNAPG